jgi:O-antigen ligase
MESFVRAPEPRAVVATSAVCIYLGGFAFPFAPDIPLLLLAILGVVAMSRRGGEGVAMAPHVLLGVSLLLASTILSIALSAAPARSLRLSAPLIPATLLFLLARHADARSARWIVTTLSVLGLGLSVAVVATAARGDASTLHDHVSIVGSPLLVEANDIAIVAILAPLSVALLSIRPPRWIAAVAVGSLIAAVIAVCILRSRVAILTMVVSIGTFAWVAARSRRAVWKSIAVLALVTLILDAGMGFPLTSKFQKLREPRIALWFTAAAMFADAPVLGHGPHTFAVLADTYAEGLDQPRWVPTVRRMPPWAHSLYFEFLAERGLVGLASLIVLLSLTARSALRNRRQADHEARALGAGVAAAFAGFCFAGIFELSFLRLWVVVVFFTLVGIASPPAKRKGSVVQPC